MYFLAMAPLLDSALCKESGLVWLPQCALGFAFGCPLGLCCFVLFRCIVGVSLFFGGPYIVSCDATHIRRQLKYIMNVFL